MAGKVSPALIGGLIALAGGATAAGVYLATKKNYTVLLTSSSTTIPVDGTESFTVNVTENNSSVSDVSVILTEITTETTTSETTNSFGIAEFNITISKAGTYAFQAEAGGVKSGTVSITATSVSCPCGQVYLDGQCEPLAPQDVFWYLPNGGLISAYPFTLPLCVRVGVIDVVIGYTVDGVTERLRTHTTECTDCANDRGNSGFVKTLSGTASFEVSAVTDANIKIGCQTFNLYASPTSMSFTDQMGITWALDISAPSTVTAGSDGIADVTLSWTLTRSWNGDNVIPSLTGPPSSETLDFGTLILTAELPDSTITSQLVLSTLGNVCVNGYD